MSRPENDRAAIVKPQLLKGFRDYGPAEQIAREKLLAGIRESFELMGFLPFRTATVESAETLLGPHYNQDSLKELFGFTGPENVDMSLRYEFTLSLARFVAGNPDLPLPFRGYQYGSVFRVDKPGPGRFREFMQCDIDIVGTRNMLADAEIVAAMINTLDRLGVKRFRVRFSNRKILNGLMEFAGISAERGSDVMRVVDKLEKQGKTAVVAELGPGRTDQSGDRIPGLHLPDNQVQQIEAFLDVAEHPTADPLLQADELLGSIAISREGIDELRQIQQHLSGMALDADKFAVDLTIVRGLGYYTGPVFETTLLDLPDYGSIFSGGRYDNLVDRFLRQSIPATGSSIGLDRLLAALIELKALKLENATAQVLVTVMDRERIGDYLAIVRQLRAAGIRSEIYTGDTKNITKQVRYADKVGIPLVVIAGSQEFESGQVAVKNLTHGRQKSLQTSNREDWLKGDEVQESIPKAELVAYIKKQLSEAAV